MNKEKELQQIGQLHGHLRFRTKNKIIGKGERWNQLPTLKNAEYVPQGKNCVYNEK